MTGISKGTFYYYFNGKVDLFSTMFVNWIKEMLSGIETTPREVSDADDFWNEAEHLLLLIAERFNGMPGFSGMLAHGIDAKSGGNSCFKQTP